jgi:hypothetical protein
VLPALLGGDTLVLRMSLCLVGGVAMALAVLIWRRDRHHARAVAAEAARRRLDQSLFQSRLDVMHETVTVLLGQVEQLRAEAGQLRAEVATVHAGKVAAEEELRRLRAEVAAEESLRRRRAAVAAEEVSEAAAVLDAFEVGGDGAPDWVSTWVSSLFDEDGDLVIDLTMPEDTAPLDLRAVSSA